MEYNLLGSAILLFFKAQYYLPKMWFMGHFHQDHGFIVKTADLWAPL